MASFSLSARNSPPDPRLLAEFRLLAEHLVSRSRNVVDVDRRLQRRIEIPYLFRLDATSTSHKNAPEPLLVLGRDLSPGGMGFCHDCPIASRWVTLTLLEPAGADFAVDLELTWCRYTGAGLYESGGRLIRTFGQPLIGRAG